MAASLPPPTTEAPLLAWLLDALRPTNRTRVKQLLRHGRVSVNGVPTTRFDHPLRSGDRVEVTDAPPERPLSLQQANPWPRAKRSGSRKARRSFTLPTRARTSSTPGRTSRTVRCNFSGEDRQADRRAGKVSPRLAM